MSGDSNYSPRLMRVSVCALLLCGCGVAEPGTGDLVVTVATSGFDAGERYTLMVDRLPGKYIAVNETRQISGLTAGLHTVRLFGVMPWCSASVPGDAEVVITPEETTQFSIEVVCLAITGMVRVSTVTSGPDADADGYLAYTTQPDDWFADAGGKKVATTGVAVLGPVGNGERDVWLDEIAPNCQVLGHNPKRVVVPGWRATRDTVNVDFEVSCQAAVKPESP